MIRKLLLQCLVNDNQIIISNNQIVINDNQMIIAQSAGAVEYIDCFSAERHDSLNEFPEYSIKQSDGEASVMPELWGMRNSPSLLSLPGPLWSGAVAPERSYLWVK